MSPGILGKKIGMTQVFTAEGQVVPVTLVKAGPCVVTQRKTPATDGYDAVQLGLVEYAKKQNKPAAGHLKKSGADGVKFLREFRLESGNGDLKPGDRVLADEFKPRERVDVIGMSKGRGFAGLVKRHHFRGGPATHGSMFHRRIGSIGMRQTPGRSWKNQAMPGHMGSERRTVQNLRIVKVIADKNLLLVKGAIPGANGDDVIVRTAIKGQWALPTPPAAAPADAKKGAKPAAAAKPAAPAKK